MAADSNYDQTIAAPAGDFGRERTHRLSCSMTGSLKPRRTNPTIPMEWRWPP